MYETYKWRGLDKSIFSELHPLHGHQQNQQHQRQHQHQQEQTSAAMQPLADIFCCCKNAATDPVEQKKKKTTFPEIVIQVEHFLGRIF